MNKSSDDLVAEEDEYRDNVENRDLQSLIELRYVHDGQTQYATKDDVAIRIFEGIELLPSKSISFIASKDKGYIGVPRKLLMTTSIMLQRTIVANARHYKTILLR